jgi:hypothetical protein
MLDELPERLSLQQFHCNEGSPIGLINFVDGANVRMIQSRSSTRFTSKPLQCLQIGGEIFGKEFKGNAATEFEVFSLVNDAHASPADFAKYTVMGYSLPHVGREWR